MPCSNCGQPADVPPAVVDALRRVRDTGITDMYQREMVIVVTRELGMAEAARWLASNRHLYFDALRRIDRDDSGALVLAA
jgi:hypothetical protein